MKSFILFCIICSLTFTGCDFIQSLRLVRNTCINGIGFDGEIERLNAAKTIEDDYVKEIKNLKKNHERIITVGHQLGDFEEYPKFPGDKQNYRFLASDMMKRSFNELGLKGVEFDIQLGPDKKNVYIIHERIRDKYQKYSEVPKDEKIFFDNNELKKLLKEFIANEFYNKEKFLYIELKAKKAYALDDKGEEEETIEKALKIIGEVIDETVDKSLQNNMREHISFISFNHLTLKKVIELGRRNKNIKKHKLYYIAGSNEPWKIMLSRFCPEVNNSKNLLVQEERNKKYGTIWDWVNNNNDLSGIWFSPNHIENVVTELNNINERRANDGLQQFEYFLSTYQKNRDDFFKVLKNKNNSGCNDYFYMNIKGLIFDIKK